MTPQFPIRANNRFLAPFLVPFVIGLLMVALGLTGGRVSADVTGQLSDNQLTSGDLGIATIFVSPDAVVHTPDGHSAGPDGVAGYIASLQETFPKATFTTSDIQSVDNLLIVDWQGAIDGQVIIPGRTLITIEEGAITDIWFLNLNNVAPVAGEPSVDTAHAAAAAPVSVYYELPYEQGRPVVVEQSDAAGTGGHLVIVDEMGNAVSPEQAPITVNGAAPESFATDADQDPD